MIQKRSCGKFIFTLGVLLALSPSYACSFVLNLIWNVEIYYVAVIPFLTSFLMAVALSDIKSALVCSIISLILGSLIAIIIISGPVIIYNPELTEIATTIALSSVVRLLVIVNAAPTFIGVLLGYLIIGES